MLGELPVLFHLRFKWIPRWSELARGGIMLQLSNTEGFDMNTKSMSDLERLRALMGVTSHNLLYNKIL